MAKYDVLWRKGHSSQLECITVEATSKIWAENIAFSKISEITLNFTIVVVREKSDFVFAIPPGCHYWGGQIRNNSIWRKQW